MRELAISEDGRISEMEPQLGAEARPCSAIRVLNLSGPVFFAVAGELDTALERFVRDPELRVLIVRMRQAELLDVTTASVLEAAAQKLAANGRTLFLLGLRRPAIEFLERTGLTARIGKDNVFPATLAPAKPPRMEKERSKVYCTLAPSTPPTPRQAMAKSLKSLTA